MMPFQTFEVLFETTLAYNGPQSSIGKRNNIVVNYFFRLFLIVHIQPNSPEE